MNKVDISLILSILAVAVAAWSGYTQYKQRQDMIQENIKLELKVLWNDEYLDPLSLRILSGVEERKQLNKFGILVTNLGFSTVRLTEVGYQDYDLPEYVDFSKENGIKSLSSGEQVLLPLNKKIVNINGQLTEDIKTGDDNNAKIFAITTKENRFEVPAVIKSSNDDKWANWYKLGISYFK